MMQKSTQKGLEKRQETSSHSHLSPISLSLSLSLCFPPLSLIHLLALEIYYYLLLFLSLFLSLFRITVAFCLKASMAALVLSLLLLAMAGHSSATWCVCKTGLSDAVLQKTLDYACGQGADCNPTKPKGSCFNPDNVRAHCNYAVNSFFQKKGQSSGSCDFSGTATVSTTDPSYTGCAYPTSAGGSGGSSGSTTMTPGTTNPKGSTSTNTLPGGNSPYSGNPTNGVFGTNSTAGAGGVNPDYSTDSSAFALKNSSKFFISLLLSSFLML